MTIPTLTPVQSSLLVAIGFDDATNELIIQFPRGATYAYQNPDSPGEARLHHDKLLHPDTESVGKYFLGHIKNKPQLKYRRLDDMPVAEKDPLEESAASGNGAQKKTKTVGLKPPDALKDLF